MQHNFDVCFDTMARQGKLLEQTMAKLESLSKTGAPQAPESVRQNLDLETGNISYGIRLPIVQDNTPPVPLDLPGSRHYTHVSASLQNTIHSNGYIKLDNMLKAPEVDDGDLRIGDVQEDGGHRLVLNNKLKSAKITNIQDWMLAFLTYSNIRCTSAPEEAVGLLSYMTDILTMHVDKFAYKTYDEEFIRRKANSRNITWTTKLTDLYAKACALGRGTEGGTSSVPAPSSNKSGPFTPQSYQLKRIPGHCWPWQIGQCTDDPCDKGAHLCEICHKSHLFLK